ncbi:Ig-like domain repeat protein, partial [Methanobrevibacter sp.]
NSTNVTYTYATGVNAIIDHPEAIVVIETDKIIVSGLPVGVYTMNVTTRADENHTAVSKTVTVTVTKAASLVEIEPVTTVTYATDVTVNFNVVNATEVTYIVTTRDGTTIVIPNKTVENVNATGNVIKLSDLAVGNYTITIANDENCTYAGDVKSADFTVDKAPSTLNITDIEFYEGSLGSAPISYIGVKNITYEVIDHPEAVISVQDGVIIVSNLSANSYVLKVTAQPDENHIGVEKEVNVIVKVKEDPEMNVTNDSPVEGENATVTVDLPKDAEGNVTVTLKNGTNYTASVENGKATVNVPNAPVGDNNVTVTYSGDEKYNGQSTNATVHVKKILIDASDMKRGWDSPFDYQAKLIDEEGNPIEGKTITFTVGEKQYTATTDSNGIAKLTQTTLDVGNYDITSSYANGASSTNKLEIVKRLIENKDLTMDYKDGSNYKVRAIGDDGNPVGKNVVVSISINGVTYEIKTDENGYAVLPINLIPKKYTATSKYHKTTVKNKVTVKQTLKLVKKTVTVKKGKRIVLKATLKWTSGKALKGKVIKFKFRGKFYKAKTNSKGVAKVTIKNKKVLKKLKKGKKYTYSAKYIKNGVKGKVKIK